jgi:hypothetical protein
MRGGGVAVVIDHWDLAESIGARVVTVRVNTWVHLVGHIGVVWASVGRAVCVVGGGGGALVGVGSGTKDSGRLLVVTSWGSGLSLIAQNVGVGLALRQVGIVRWASSVSMSVLVGAHARIQLVGKLGVVWTGIGGTAAVVSG